MKELIEALEKVLAELKKNAVSGKIESSDPHTENKALYAQDALVHERPWGLWEYQYTPEGAWYQHEQTPLWNKDCQYRRKQQPTKKLVDWSCRLLKGCNTNKGELLQIVRAVYGWRTSLVNFIRFELLKVIPPADDNSNWQAYNGEDLYLLHEAGFVVQVRYWRVDRYSVGKAGDINYDNIAAYRIIAIRDGFTDNPEEVV